ncbi:SWIM zinc finger family protein [Streptomyces cellulosae]|nr:SWIM zinc finger family protein [Streptomyces cellulosae]
MHRARQARRGAAAGVNAGDVGATSEAVAGPHAEHAPSASGDGAPSPDAAGEASHAAAVAKAPGAARPPAEAGPADASYGSLADGPGGKGVPRGDEDAAAPTPAARGSATPAPDGHEASGPTDNTDPHPSSRPGDIAREALRAAREERARALAREQVEAAKRPRRDPEPRIPRTTRGDRAADRRAREIRETLADAFRMPDMADDPMPDAPRRGPTAEPPATLAPDKATTTTDATRAPTNQGPAEGPPRAPDREPAPGTEAEPAGATDEARAAARGREPASAPARVRREPSPTLRREAPATWAAHHAAPRSMAAPTRDGDHRRTFPPFPPRPSGDGEPFAETWWGRAWVTALEDGALDAARLARGRGYAEQGHVDAITVTPGLVLAYVQGSRPRPYRVQVRLRTFDDADWDRFLDAAADRPGHIAALLDKEMPQSLADCGIPLLPGPGDLAPRCSCPDSGHPCKHAAALCYQTARLLDADPFVLLLLRGRGEREVIDALSRLSAARAARAAQGREPEPLPGVRATDAVSRRGPELPPLPAPLPPPQHPEQPPVYPASPGGPDPLALDQLATDAAARAHALLTTGRDPVGPLSLWHDAVRLAAARPGSGLTAGSRELYASLARAAGRTPGDLARAVAAWRQGGPTGLAVLEEPWDPPAGRFDRARPLLLAADLPAFRPWRNRLTHPRGHVQLRLGHDNLWYAYESEPGHDDWWPRGTPDPDPVGALTGLDTLGEG